MVKGRSFLGRDFFNHHHLKVARDLIGTRLLWDGCGGTVVETEAYAMVGDEACHAHHRPSTRKFFTENPPGTAYIYLNYGVHWLLNVLAADGIILLRALEPADGIAVMRERRGREKLTELCSGPGKLGAALALDGKRDHGLPMTGVSSRGFSSREGKIDPEIITDRRIGISKAVDLPWRFLLDGCPHVSVRAPAPIKKRAPQ